VCLDSEGPSSSSHHRPITPIKDLSSSSSIISQTEKSTIHRIRMDNILVKETGQLFFIIFKKDKQNILLLLLLFYFLFPLGVHRTNVPDKKAPRPIRHGAYHMAHPTLCCDATRNATHPVCGGVWQ
jgi:hypothetical protein